MSVLKPDLFAWIILSRGEYFFNLNFRVLVQCSVMLLVNERFSATRLGFSKVAKSFKIRLIIQTPLILQEVFGSLQNLTTLTSEVEAFAYWRMILVSYTHQLFIWKMVKSSGDVLRETLGNVQPLLIPVEGILLEVKQITIMNLQMYTKIIELILMTISSFIVKYTKKPCF